VTVRVRFAPSPTGSLHVGNALTAVANRTYADRTGGALVLRIDDTDPERTVAGGERAILDDLRWLGIDWEEGPVRQSQREVVYAAAIERALDHGGARASDGSVRFGRTTLARPDGTATYQLASVADDLDLGITHVIRGSDHRPNEPVQRAIAIALGGDLPEVIHHGLVLGDDGKKLSKRHGHSSVGSLREAGIPAAAVRAYLDELGQPAHDVKLDLARLHRLSIDAIAAMPDDELAAAADAPAEVVPALRGARDLVEARAYAGQIVEPEPTRVDEAARPTLERFAELRAGHADPVAEREARELVREVKAVGGDLKAVRTALTGAARGPELWTVLVALSLEETLRRVHAAAARVPCD
jgi:tRNA synthetases class I (E and Q), catalytic domain